MITKDFGKQNLFMPDATRGAVRFLTTKQLEETGTKALVTNTLHILINIGMERIRELGGIKSFMNWGGDVLTDSGGFQVFSLIHSGKWQGKIDSNGAVFKSPKEGNVYTLTPESSIDIQMCIGSDVLVTLDDCRKTDLTLDEAKESVERTISWASRAKKHFESVYGGTKESGKLLSCVVQGANFPNLRKECAIALSDMNFDGYNFGGYVVNDDGNLVIDEMRVVIENTPRDKFKYAMGVGKPEDIRKASVLGYRLFDTVLVTRNARHGTLYSKDIEDEVLRIGNSEYAKDVRPIDSSCDCYTCKNHTRSYVHHMLKIGEATGMILATIHNLRYYQRLIEDLNKK